MGLERPEPDTTPVSVRFEHRQDALGVGTSEPRLSWQVRTDDPAWRQTAYEVELDGGTTAHVDCAEQVLVPWPFAPLASRSGASVRIRVACGTRWSDWSAPVTVETGLLRPDDWTARFITPTATAPWTRPPPSSYGRSCCGRTWSRPASTPPLTVSTPRPSTAPGSVTRSSPPAGPATATDSGTRPMTSPPC